MAFLPLCLGMGIRTAYVGYVHIHNLYKNIVIQPMANSLSLVSIWVLPILVFLTWVIPIGIHEFIYFLRNTYNYKEEINDVIRR